MSSWGQPVLYSLYVYKPSNMAPAIFAVLYGISTVAHIWQCHRYKAFRLVGLQCVCGVLFTVGYALREYGAFNYLYRKGTDDRSPLLVYIFSQVFIYVCPPLLELANYHVLGRIFHFVPSAAPIPAPFILRIFGGLMAVVEALNALGAALSSNPTSTSASQALGAHLAVAAVCMQLGIIAIFFVLAGMFQHRLSSVRAAAARSRTGGIQEDNGGLREAQVILVVMYASMLLILARTVYRLVEHLPGSDHTRRDITNLAALQALSPLLRYEIFFLVFDGALMLANSILWNVWHPGRLLPRDPRVYLAQDGSRVLREVVVADGRAWWEKVLHVVTFGMFFGAAASSKRKRSGESCADEMEMAMVARQSESL
ncbi:RTA1 domain-containing protein [Microdochium bolleyi]|uniref:RTA1 domain-containing protein n=1 Tax=Microdochium bolleyi TaxID=196109 RepID=A0A136IQS7_9PEZI|nr:RTA1 domain-containing protein [Microdochium bolleyi]